MNVETSVSINGEPLYHFSGITVVAATSNENAETKLQMNASHSINANREPASKKKKKINLRINNKKFFEMNKPIQFLGPDSWQWWPFS